MSPRTRRHPPHPHRLFLRVGKAEVPAPRSRLPGKDKGLGKVTERSFPSRSPTGLILYCLEGISSHFLIRVCSDTCCGYWIKIPDRAPERTARGAPSVHRKCLDGSLWDCKLRVTVSECATSGTLLLSWHVPRWAAGGARVDGENRNRNPPRRQPCSW